MSHKPLTAANSNLMGVLKFTAEDLELNKQGKLSQNQILNQEQKMAEHMNMTKKIMSAVLIITLIFMAFKLMSDENMRRNIFTIVPVMGLIFIAYYFGTPWYLKKLNEKNRKFLSTEGKVQCLNGKVELISTTSNSRNINMVSSFSGEDLRTAHSIKIAGETLQVELLAVERVGRALDLEALGQRRLRRQRGADHRHDRVDRRVTGVADGQPGGEVAVHLVAVAGREVDLRIPLVADAHGGVGQADKLQGLVGQRLEAQQGGTEGLDQIRGQEERDHVHHAHRGVLQRGLELVLHGTPLLGLA